MLLLMMIVVYRDKNIFWGGIKRLCFLALIRERRAYITGAGNTSTIPLQLLDLEWACHFGFLWEPNQSINQSPLANSPRTMCQLYAWSPHILSCTHSQRSNKGDTQRNTQFWLNWYMKTSWGECLLSTHQSDEPVRGQFASLLGY